MSLLSSDLSFKMFMSLAVLVAVLRSAAANGIDGNVISVINAPLLTQKIGTNRSIIVDAAGNGEFKSIQAAVDSVPEGNSETKPYIFMRGNGRGRTVVVWSQSSEDNIESATLRVEAKHFTAFGISFKVREFWFLNPLLRINLWLHMWVPTRLHFTTALSSAPITPYLITRADIIMKTVISKALWTSYLAGHVPCFTYVLGEYRNTGYGSIANERVPWAKQLTDEEAEPLLSIDFIHGKEWLPAWNLKMSGQL